MGAARLMAGGLPVPVRLNTHETQTVVCVCPCAMAHVRYIWARLALGLVPRLGRREANETSRRSAMRSASLWPLLRSSAQPQGQLKTAQDRTGRCESVCRAVVCEWLQVISAVRESLAPCCCSRLPGRTGVNLCAVPSCASGFKSSPRFASPCSRLPGRTRPT
jgi:hypothetical protein